jgi:CHAT domain-containing protein
MPQGELFLVPFPALLNAQNQPLITQHTILTAPSIQTLDLTHKTAQSHPKGTRPALVVGNPTMPAISTVIGDPPKKLAALPGSETEAIALAKQLNTQAMTGSSAQKDKIVQQMQNAGIIHLATHGLLDSFKGETPGAIALAPNGTDDRNDGLLTSGEIFDLKLNADLVVLSACDTGRGEITGDGVIGLSRSLFVAGTPSVIVSLWKVPDDSTAFLMTEFYKNWKDRKLDKAQALRQAMLTTRVNYPQPLNWAAFTLIGEAD